MTQKQKKYIALAGILAFVILSGLVFWFAGRPLIRFVSEPEYFRAWLDARGVWGRLIFLCIVVLQVFVAIIPGEPIEIAAGYAFGFWEGTLLCILGMTIGGAAVFVFVRKFGVKALEVFFSREKIASLRFLQNSRHVYFFLIIAFLLPGTPKDILSYVAGLTPIRFYHWLLLTSLCRLPSVVTSTLGGNALGTGEHWIATVVFLLTALISLIGYRLYRRMHKNENSQTPS